MALARRGIAFACALLPFLFHWKRTCASNHPSPKFYTYHVVAEYPHDHAAFTQGLEYDRLCNDTAEQCLDVFWESTGGVPRVKPWGAQALTYIRFWRNTGLYGQSTVRQVSLASGKVLQLHKMDEKVFGEGLTRMNDTLYQITWLTGKGFKYSTKDLTPLGSFDTGLRDGWGLANDGRYLIVTDNTHKVSWIDPGSFKVVKTLEVKDGDVPVHWLNELEYIDGELWANVWQRDCIARIDLASGQVTHWMLMHGLKEDLLKRQSSRRHPMDVLNGIAWDPHGKRIFVTGKLWPTIFEIVPKEFPPEKVPTLAHVRGRCHPPKQN